MKQMEWCIYNGELKKFEGENWRGETRDGVDSRPKSKQNCVINDKKDKCTCSGSGWAANCQKLNFVGPLFPHAIHLHFIVALYLLYEKYFWIY